MRALLFWFRRRRILRDWARGRVGYSEAHQRITRLIKG
jgi:hypothetical protein